MKIPRDPRLESTVALLREGYDFIGNNARRLHSPIFESRILLQRTYCLQGHEAAELFYASPHLSRVDAAPRMLIHTLFGSQAIQGLDGPAHRRRKTLFLELLSGEQAARLTQQVDATLMAALPGWAAAGTLDFLSEMQRVLFRAVMSWAGLPASEHSARRQHQFVALIEGAGSIGLGQLRGRWARRRAEHWGARLIRRQRRSGDVLPAGSPADRLARYREEDGQPLAPRVAAVELLNLLRPVVAIAYFLLYAMVELARRPLWEQRLREDDSWLLPFAQEVRRLYAFFPFVAARVTQPFDWRGMRLQRGARVLLDLYGSNRCSDVWENPEAFAPERFKARQLDAHTLIPQGGGQHDSGHRCPGEWVTLDIMQNCLRRLTRNLRYQAPAFAGAPLCNRFPLRFQQRLWLSRVELPSNNDRSTEAQPE
ncbi:cytochrome P450 [Pseudomonas sp. NCHU5208]|uniref:cytochrome P450 n=1 Tax=unclassified Pseudomonas TaxID=196821 RepID=UPI003F9C8FAF